MAAAGDRLTTSFADVDLHSRSATETPRFDFPLKQSEQSLISLLRCTDPAATCIAIKDFLLVSFSRPDLFAPGIVRMERQDLDRLEKGKEGWMLLAESAAFLNGDRQLPVTITGIIVPGDSNVRWSYTVLCISDLLRKLNDKHLLHLRASWTPGQRDHTRFATYIRESFLAAVTIPHATDYINAMQVTDYCVSIIEPETALERLESNEILYFAHKNPLESCLDLQDDRYLFHLHPAEREVASIAHYKCAEYLFIKRNFFRNLFEIIYRNDKKPAAEAPSSKSKTIHGGRGRVDSPAPAHVSDGEEEAATPQPPVTPSSSRRSGAMQTRSGRNVAINTSVPPSESNFSAVWKAAGGRRVRVRTDNAHRHWLEDEYQMKSQRARLVVAAWRELGFLDESRYVPWVKAGGMGLCEEEDDEENDEEEGPIELEG